MSNLVTWSPTTKGTGVILSNNDLTASHYWSYQSVKTNQSKNSGKWYLELRIDTYFNFTMIGIIDDSLSVLSNTIRTNSKFYGLTRATNSTLYTYNGATIINTVNGQLPLNSVIGILLDMDLGKVDFYIDGVYTTSILNIKNNIQDANIVMTTQASEDAIKPKVTANFGASNFLYTPSNLPSGVKSYDGTQTVSSFNKTLILQNGEYKKWIQGNPQTVGTNLIPVMTSTTAPSGEVITSGSYDTGRSAWKAFDGVNNSYTSSWASTAITPSWVGYKFPSNKIVNVYSLTSPTDNSSSSLDGDGMPKSWVFQGSDDNITWVDLDTRNNESLWGNSEKRTYMFTNNVAYKSYRIYITSNNRPTSNITYISEIGMYAVTSYSPSSWQTVSNTLPTVIQFTEQGMDSLTPLLDRKVMKLEPQVMTQDSTPVGNGKVYRKKVSLNKYFDIKTITTETRKS